MNKNIMVIGILFLFILSSVAPLSFGINVELIDENKEYDRLTKYILSDPYSPEINIPEKDETETSRSLQPNKQKEEPIIIEVSNNAPLDSPWPMYCHDVRHTGRSPYSTASNPGTRKWRFDTDDAVCTGSPIIDEEGIIYIGARDLFAIYPNGTEKWKFDIGNNAITSAPAIDENGILYVGTTTGHPDYFYAIYKCNGTLKWRCRAGDNIYSSPAIGEDGTIYVCDSGNWKIKALYSNGTLKWSYKTGHVVYSSPAIGQDGTIYCGSHDNYLYALSPNNGTLKWKYKTGHWIRTAPCIADDGTIYVVSRDAHLHAINPNGTRKWTINVGAGTSPTIGQDGTIYCGYDILYAVNPDGSIKWSFDPGPDRRIRGGTPCNSADGTIFFGTHIGETDGGELIAVNPDGTERWRIMVATVWTDSAPAIGADGTIYIGSWDRGPPHGWGWLHAIGELDPDAPSVPLITGQTSGTAGKEYEYKFKSTSPLNRDIYYYINWGDNTIKNWFGPFSSGEVVKVTHTYSDQKTYIIKARAKDSENLWSPWGTLEVTMPRNKETTYSFFFQFLERFPLLKQLFSFYN